MAFLEVKNIEKKFGETRVLKGVSFEMEKGEVVALIGSSGNGKTTLLRCLNFLETPDSGTITVDGKQVFPPEQSKVEKRQSQLTFGLVFQNFQLFPQYTALENVCLGLNEQSRRECKEAGLKWGERRKALKQKRAENREKAMEILARVGLAEKTGNYPCELSGGQQQRVAIARALALSPSILCFDEPTSALDPELTGEVLKVIQELEADDRTMIIVTHEIDFAKKVADKILFMADGEIAVAGTPEEVFEKSQDERLCSFLSKVEE